MIKTYTATEAFKMRKEAARNKPKKSNSKSVKSERQKAMDRAIEYFSLFARATEADEYGRVTCKTCGKNMAWKESDGSCHWGHYMTCGHNSTRFEIMNGGIQCKKCNTFRAGEQVKMRAYLVRRYGEQEVSLLEIRAVQRKDLDAFELRETAKFYRTEFNKIVKQKGLT